jgi:hypothetical protein
MNNKMILNIITPCTRPENLHKISKSINIPRENYRWIVVFDDDKLPSLELIPDNCETYFHKDPLSSWGNAQRNFAIDKIEDGYVYFNDDDTILHEDLFFSIKDMSFDFLSFSQQFPNGKIRLKGDGIGVNLTDSNNFVVSRSLIGNTRWELSIYSADGIFARQCFLNSSKTLFIDKVLSTYNYLNNGQHNLK